MATPQKHEYFYMPLVTLDNHMVWGESSLKMSALWLKGFGIYDVLKIWRKRMTDLINQLINYEAVRRTASATPGLLGCYRVSQKNALLTKVQLDQNLQIFESK